MKRKQQSGVFIMEMIMVVFFFIICASICILVFVKSDRMSREASDLNQAVLIAQSVGEVWKEEGIQGLKNRFDAKDIGSGRYICIMAFDKNGSPLDEEEQTETEDRAMYTAQLIAGGLDGQAKITVSRGEDRIYTLSVNRRQREQEGADGKAGAGI